MKIYVLGPAGTFSHEAAMMMFPNEKVEFVPNFDKVFDALTKDESSVGVVPIENSLHGSVDEILDLLRESDVRIWKTQDLSIKHAFGSLDPKKVTKIASHSQALRQCRVWLKKHFPDAEHLQLSSTAAAVELAKTDPSVGAIASAKLLKSSGLSIMSEDIEGSTSLELSASANTTRFAVVSKKDPCPELARNSMMIVLHPSVDRPGLLHDLLVPFKIYDLNLSRIESRPAGTKFGDYIFFIDFQGSPGEPRTESALKDLRKIAAVEVLGQW